MRIGFAATALALVAAPIIAHDFWIQPSRFQTQPGATFPATFQVGHAALRQRWGQLPDRVVLLSDISAAGRRDVRGEMTPGGEADLVTRFASPGIHILAMQSTYALSDLPAIRFNDYAREEGLALVLAHRARTGKAGVPGRERYSRRAKAVIQVGAQTAANQMFATRAVGLKLEIVPERNPYGLDASRLLPVRVMYKGRRLAGAMVKLTNLEFDAKPLATAVTDRNGRATFRVPVNGEWLINVIWGEPVTGDPKADFDTTFSSLTFGYGRVGRRR